MPDPEEMPVVEMNGSNDEERAMDIENRTIATVNEGDIPEIPSPDWLRS